MKKNNFKSLMQAAVLICTPLVIASCDDVFGDADNPIPSYMSIKEADVNLELHADRPDAATYTRTAIAATGAEIVYSSSKPEIATVDAKTGKITAVSEGECQIIAEATGKDSHGNMTYQPQKSSFTVKVKDYRARISLKEDATKATFNSALIDAKPIDLAEVLDVFPKTGLTIQYGKINATTKAFEEFTPAEIAADPVISDITSGKVTLKTAYAFTDTPAKHSFTTKVVAHIAAAPKDFETKSFKDQQTTAEFTIEVREGIAYISGYDADGKAIKKSMFFLDNDEEGTLPNYTKLSPKLVSGGDVYLNAGWYYLDNTISFDSNIRAKGDVNIILKDGNYLNMTGANNSIMDESAKQSYSLNIYPEPGLTGEIYNLKAIQDFKDVNIFGGKVWTYPTIKAVETVNIYNGEDVRANLKNVGTAIINDGYYDNIQTVTSLNMKKGKVYTSFKGIGTATIEDVTFSCILDDITTLNFKKGTVAGLNKIGTANIEDGTFNSASLPVSSTSTIWAAFNDIKTLNFKKGTVSGQMNKIGTATVSDGTINGIFNGTTLNLKKGTVNSAKIVADLIIDGGSVNVNATDVGIKGKITMNDGTLTVKTSATDKYAVVGEVTVAKGKFTAEGANYHAIDGKLNGTFYGSTDKTNWTKIENEDRPKFITTVEPKKP